MTVHCTIESHILSLHRAWLLGGQLEKRSQEEEVFEMNRMAKWGYICFHLYLPSSILTSYYMPIWLGNVLFFHQILSVFFLCSSLLFSQFIQILISTDLTWFLFVIMAIREYRISYTTTLFQVRLLFLVISTTHRKVRINSLHIPYLYSYFD